jgi:hypothetical protein
MSLHFRMPLKHHQRLRVRHRQRSQEQRVHITENRRVRANAQCQRHDRQKTECLARSHRAKCVAHILNKLFKQCPTPRRPRVFLHQSVVPQVSSRCVSCFFLGQSISAPLIGFFLLMKLQLFLQFCFLLLAERQPTEFFEKRTHCASSSPGLRINPIARENAFHLECSLVNCFRPRFVNW